MEDLNLGVRNLSNSYQDSPKRKLNQNKEIENEIPNKINSTSYISLDQFFQGRKFLGIKFPAKIENPENAIKSIGGLEEIKKNVKKLIKKN